MNLKIDNLCNDCMYRNAHIFSVDVGKALHLVHMYATKHADLYNKI